MLDGTADNGETKDVNSGTANTGTAQPPNTPEKTIDVKELEKLQAKLLEYENKEKKLIEEQAKKSEELKRKELETAQKNGEFEKLFSQTKAEKAELEKIHSDAIAKLKEYEAEKENKRKELLSKLDKEEQVIFADASEKQLETILNKLKPNGKSIADSLDYKIPNGTGGGDEINSLVAKANKTKSPADFLNVRKAITEKFNL
jgi:DNA repair exonuclease SbcCD ATPase subunit